MYSMVVGDDKFAVEDVGAGTIGVCGYLNAGTADEVEAIFLQAAALIRMEIQAPTMVRAKYYTTTKERFPLLK